MTSLCRPGLRNRAECFENTTDSNTGSLGTGVINLNQTYIREEVRFDSESLILLSSEALVFSSSIHESKD
jgi:hypothetical protein